MFTVVATDKFKSDLEAWLNRSCVDKAGATYTALSEPEKEELRSDFCNSAVALYNAGLRTGDTLRLRAEYQSADYRELPLQPLHFAVEISCPFNRITHVVPMAMVISMCPVRKPQLTVKKEVLNS